MADRGFDKQEFENIYRMYYKRMFGLCMKYVKDETTAEDLVQDSFVTILTKINTLKDKTKLESWMFSIAKNTCLKYLEKKKLFSDISIDDTNVADTQENISQEQQEATMSYDTLMQMVDKLPEGYKKVFTLYAIDGLTHEQIAKQLNIKPNTSSSQLYRAKQMLKSMIVSYWSLGIVPLLVIAVLLFNFREINDTIPADNPLKEITKKTTSKAETTPQSAKTQTYYANTRIYNNDTSKGNNDIVIHKDNIYSDSVILSKEEVLTDNYNYDNEEDLPKITLEEISVQDEIVNLWENCPVATKDSEHWTLDIVFISSAVSLSQISDIQSLIHNTDNSPTINPEENFFDEVKYHLPITFSLMADKRLNKYFSIDCGLVYTYLKTDFISYFKNTLSYRLQYAGIKSQILYHYLQTKYFDATAGLGSSVEIPFHHKALFYADNTTEYYNLEAKTQWSVSFSLGVDYKITDKIGIFIQPQVNYFFDNGDNIASYRKKYKLNIDFPIGIRIKLI